ncbi:MAG: outer membrane beta-barrel protein [Longimicrobiales bacterium]|nr:outer membrane beta-barrel protein [Longimicrobiales bacterium]
MKTPTLFGILIALALPAVVEAQAAMGLRVGARNAELATGQSTGAITTAVYAAYLGFGVSDRLAIQVEAVYGTRGADGLGLGTDALDASAPPARVEMRYLEVPLLLRAGFPGERLLISVFAGPYVGFLVACEVAPAGAASRSCNEAAAGQRFDPRSTDVGLAAGVGLDLAFGGSTLFADARYTVGLQSIESGGDPFDARHTGVALTAGLAVPLGR